MTIVSNDSSWWPVIDAYRFSSYFTLAAVVAVVYDWALTFGQEVELVWRQRWSLMTFLYLGVRYLGILSAALTVLNSLPTISLTGTSTHDRHRCRIMYLVLDWINVLVFPMLWVIIITRLYAMYQGSRKILIFLIVTFLADNIFNVVVVIMSTMHISAEEYIISGTYMCPINLPEDVSLLGSITWILGTVWEVLVLCLAVWIAVKHFRELRRHSAGEILGDCFSVLIKTHTVYFASFVAVSCFQLAINLSPTILADLYSLETQALVSLLQIFTAVQAYVLGPRLILGVREYHAKLVANSDAASAMTSIAFQERVHVSTSSSV
ncbi:uncharacterized protein EDB93DRAFT_1256192 [Suillus bovinus]|uniref:uncharacterized protein n=1 Tax=Suillus bovinus TaxID=48563 RepID=UPI001B86366C|nr:uncharacterized protein EDB93DRAFT_1256192 [Suillus bovinus]KAG2129652.1 hypothetical protein EDB93DRAFT_1256192 [Suillus bovinus]